MFLHCCCQLGVLCCSSESTQACFRCVVAQVFRARIGSMRKGLKSRVHFIFQDAPFHVSTSNMLRCPCSTRLSSGSLQPESNTWGGTLWLLPVLSAAVLTSSPASSVSFFFKQQQYAIWHVSHVVIVWIDGDACALLALLPEGPTHTSGGGFCTLELCWVWGAARCSTT